MPNIIARPPTTVTEVENEERILLSAATLPQQRRGMISGRALNFEREKAGCR